MTEEWRPTHNSAYQVSNLGRVRSVRYDAGRILAGSTIQGYPSVIFYPEVQGHLVHRLVAKAFLGPCPTGHHVMHLDDSPANARADNLRYGTPYENVHDCIDKGRQRRRKFSDAEVRVIRQRLEAQRLPTPARRLPKGACQAMADEHGVSERCIEALWTGPNYADA